VEEEGAVDEECVVEREAVAEEAVVEADDAAEAADEVLVEAEEADEVGAVVEAEEAAQMEVVEEAVAVAVAEEGEDAAPAFAASAASAAAVAAPTHTKVHGRRSSWDVLKQATWGRVDRLEFHKDKVQFDPIKPKLKLPGTMHLKLKWDRFSNLLQICFRIQLAPVQQGDVTGGAAARRRGRHRTGVGRQ
jgi:hypothetical protein